MTVEARVLQHLPHARQQITVMPRDIPAGCEPAEAMPAAVRCTLRMGRESQDFTVRLGRQPARLQIANVLYFVRYVPATQPLGFRLTLDRTDGEANCRSEVSISEAHAGQELISHHTIATNEPLKQDGWKVLQGGFEPLTSTLRQGPRTDTEGRPLGKSHFTLVRDPGLLTKIAGASLIVFGLIVLFAMRLRAARPAVFVS
jgi:hypothetical protein